MTQEEIVEEFWAVKRETDRMIKEEIAHLQALEDRYNELIKKQQEQP
jgi:hypothetical protein